MKRLSLIIVLLITAATLNAQVDFGLRANLVSKTIDLKETVGSIEAGDAEFGYQFGVS